MRRLRRLAAALAAAATLAACEDDPSGPPAVDAVSVTTPADSLALGGTMKLSLTMRDRSGAELSGRAAAWSSDNPAVAAVDGDGLVTARALGTATVTATSEGKSAAVVLRVVPVPVKTVDLGVARLSLYAGQTVQLSAVARDAAGQPLPGRTFLWATDDSTIASVTQTGLVTVKRAGQVGVSALTGGVYSVVHLDLYATKGHVWPDTLALIPGGTHTLQARSVSLKGGQMKLDSAKWESADPSVVRVDSITGAVTAVGVGQALVTARLGTTRLSSVAYVKSYGQLRFTSVGVGAIHGCGLVADGTAYCWGSGMVSQLGTAEPTNRCEILNGDVHGYFYRGTYRCSPHPVPVGGGLRFTEISVGSDRTCGVVNDGSVYCWGGGYAVNYDTGPPSSYVLAPVRVQSPVALRSVRVKGSVACGLSEAGAAYCWGSNRFGALGNGSTTDSEAAVRVSGGLTFTSVEVGGIHACGLTSDGAAYCWGRGDSGQLGAAPTHSCTTSFQTQVPCSTIPARVSGDVRFSAIRGGDDFTCGLDGAGRAYCWGAGAQGRLGNGTTQGSPAPVAVQGGLTFQSLSVGSARACGLAAGGANYCWGTYVAQGGTPEYVNPAPVRALPSFALRSVVVGSGRDCGIGADGIAYCWDATSAPAPVPGQ